MSPCSGATGAPSVSRSRHRSPAHNSRMSTLGQQPQHQRGRCHSSTERTCVRRGCSNLGPWSPAKRHRCAGAPAIHLLCLHGSHAELELWALAAPACPSDGPPREPGNRSPHALLRGRRLSEMPWSWKLNLLRIGCSRGRTPLQKVSADTHPTFQNLQAPAAPPRHTRHSNKTRATIGSKHQRQEQPRSSSSCSQRTATCCGHMN
mmetsp:Transcript_50528/g.130469  ORF Transcript_50528/g.130469 Transcript_50528/m.130469 type:complete len:205 (+) Transcript_50528:360-974(+)